MKKTKNTTKLLLELVALGQCFTDEKCWPGNYYGHPKPAVAIVTRRTYTAMCRVIGQWSLPIALLRILLSHRPGTRLPDNTK